MENRTSCFILLALGLTCAVSGNIIKSTAQDEPVKDSGWGSSNSSGWGWQPAELLPAPIADIAPASGITGLADVATAADQVQTANYAQSPPLPPTASAAPGAPGAPSSGWAPSPLSPPSMGWGWREQ